MNQYYRHVARQRRRNAIGGKIDRKKEEAATSTVCDMLIKTVKVRIYRFCNVSQSVAVCAPLRGIRLPPTRSKIAPPARSQMPPCVESEHHDRRKVEQKTNLHNKKI